LRLEVAKQYPDIHLGSTGSGEPGENKTIIGLSLGLELPLFDRNQQGIAKASQFREEIRVEYETEAGRALAVLVRSKKRLGFAAKKHDILHKEILPRAGASIDLARKSLAAGAGGALQLLDVQRSYREVYLQMLQAKMIVYEAWMDLEMAVGFPLLSFPGEEEGK